MFPAGDLHQQVQVFKIVMVPGEQHQALPGAVRQMARVLHTGELSIGRDDDLMAGLPQQPDQRRLGAVVVQIKVHPAGLEVRGAYGHWSRPAALIRASSRARSVSNRSRC